MPRRLSPPGSAGGQPLTMVDVEVMSHAARRRVAEKMAWIKSSSPPSAWLCWHPPHARLLHPVLHTPARAVQQRHPAPTCRAVVRPATASTNPKRHQGRQGLHKVAASRSQQATQPRLHARAAGPRSLPTSPRSDSNQAKSLTPPYDQPPSIALHPNSRPRPHPTHPYLTLLLYSQTCPQASITTTFSITNFITPSTLRPPPSILHPRSDQTSYSRSQLHLLFVLSVITGYTLVHFVHRGMHAQFSQLFDRHLFLIQSEGFYLFYTTFLRL